MKLVVFHQVTNIQPSTCHQTEPNQPSTYHQRLSLPQLDPLVTAKPATPVTQPLDLEGEEDRKAAQTMLAAKNTMDTLATAEMRGDWQCKQPRGRQVRL